MAAGLTIWATIGAARIQTKAVEDATGRQVKAAEEATRRQVEAAMAQIDFLKKQNEELRGRELRQDMSEQAALFALLGNSINLIQNETLDFAHKRHDQVLRALEENTAPQHSSIIISKLGWSRIGVLGGDIAWELAELEKKIARFNRENSTADDEWVNSELSDIGRRARHLGDIVLATTRQGLERLNELPAPPIHQVAPKR